MVVTIALLACGSVSGQESGPLSSSNTARPDTTDSTSFKLKGVLVSKSARLALVNGRLLEAGDFINGVEILAINETEIRVLSGARELTVGLGGTINGAKSATHIANKFRVNSNSQHVVKPGETLSGIAVRYRRDDVTMNQMMIALYDANLQAFNDNINMLYEGAVLRIPNVNALQKLTPETSAVEVARHTAIWSLTNQQLDGIIELPNTETYGPVKSGETLSGIAARVMHDDISIDQAMIALYDANRHAFNDNINVLFVGAVLRIPINDELYKLAPEMATAEVARQTKAWQTRDEQHALLTLAQTNIIASNE